MLWKRGKIYSWVMKNEIPGQHPAHRLAELSLTPYRKHETPFGVRLHAAVGRAIVGIIERLERSVHKMAPRC